MYVVHYAHCDIINMQAHVMFEYTADQGMHALIIMPIHRQCD